MSPTKTTLCMLTLSATVLAVAAGCRSSQAAALGQSAAISSDVTMSAKFQTRNPRPCPSVRHRPLNDEAAALVQCTQDGAARDHIKLMQNVSVSVSRATSQRPIYDINDIDVAAAVYPISGGMVMYNCDIVDNVMNNAGKNCNAAESLKMTGICYSNLAGDYRCQLGGGESGFIKPAEPGPTAY